MSPVKSWGKLEGSPSSLPGSEACRLRFGWHERMATSTANPPEVLYSSGSAMEFMANFPLYPFI